jgi:hypothetical protein
MLKQMMQELVWSAQEIQTSDQERTLPTDVHRQRLQVVL